MKSITKLILAFESRAYSKLTKADFFELVNLKILHPETAVRLMKEFSNVS